MTYQGSRETDDFAKSLGKKNCQKIVNTAIIYRARGKSIVAFALVVYALSVYEFILFK